MRGRDCGQLTFTSRPLDDMHRITDAAAQASDEVFADAAATIAAADQATDEAVTEDLALIGAADEVAAEELREDELAAVLAAAAHTHRRVILRVMADA
jgi:antirestriction protein ArdC